MNLLITFSSKDMTYKKRREYGSKQYSFCNFLTFSTNKKLISQLNLEKGGENRRLKIWDSIVSIQTKSTCFYLVSTNLNHVKGGIFYTFAYKKKRRNWKT